MRIVDSLALSDSGFVFNPATGDSFSVNPIGMEVIKLLKAGEDKAGVKTFLAKQYVVDAGTLERDLADFLGMLAKFKLTNGK